MPVFLEIRSYLARLQDKETVEITGTIEGVAAGPSLMLTACHPKLDG